MKRDLKTLKNKVLKKQKMNIEQLALSISEIHKQFQHKAASAINVSLTLRNWYIGFYIVEYEQNGSDRAKYGSKVIRTLSEKFSKQKLKGMSFTYLNMYRQFYLIYPQIIQALPEQSQYSIIQAVAEQSQVIIQPTVEQFKELNVNICVPPKKILNRLSFTHLSELIKIDNPLKRAFYEIECITGVWSTRELQRQISSLYFERSGLSRDKEKLSRLINQKAEGLKITDIIKNPIALDFLALPIKDIVEEKELEQALIDNLQAFMLELGNGFCFEARQKRILIDDEYFYIDLVFYHRVLKCHVLIEIKTEKFNHENIGQLDVYLQYYKHEIMQEGDNAPVGILLCTKSKPKMVKYASANKDNVFVNEFRLALPSENEIQAFVEEKIKNG